MCLGFGFITFLLATYLFVKRGVLPFMRLLRQPFTPRARASAAAEVVMVQRGAERMTQHCNGIATEGAGLVAPGRRFSYIHLQ